MRPKTKIQKQVMELSRQLPAITEAQERWMKSHCFDHYAYRLKRGQTTCLECGHQWLETLETCLCPQCKVKLSVRTTRERRYTANSYGSVLTTYKGWQVQRVYFLSGIYRKGEQARYIVTEVLQRWLNVEGKTASIARLRVMNPIYYDAWNMHSPMEIRRNHPLYRRISDCALYPRVKVLPLFRRNGFMGSRYGLPAMDYLSALLDNRMETLLKAGQTELFRYFTRYGSQSLDKLWSSVRICLRHGYMIESGALWVDYISMLQRLSRDIRNPRLVCPESLRLAHDNCMRLIQRQREKALVQKKREERLQQEEQFRQLKERFFGLAFSEGSLHIRVLESVQEYLEEGVALHHCVFTSRYYLKPQSLILSASIDGKRIETIEVSLETLQVVQSRGLQNQNTEHHDRIITLVTQNTHLIAQRLRA